MNTCTYCGKRLRNHYSMSLPWPGVPTLFACDRRLCSFKRLIKRRFKKELVRIYKKIDKLIKSTPYGYY